MSTTKTFNVFIDTNIFMQKQYDVFDDSDFKTLCQYILEGKVSLYSHKISIEEIRKHFKIEVKSNMDRYSAFQNKLRLLKNSDIPIFKNQLTENDIASQGILLIDDFFKRNNTIVLDYTGVNIESIFEDYFSNSAPFENRKDKKNEFPDAVIIASLIKNNPDNEMNIITGDTGWRDAFKSFPNFIVFDNLKDFLNVISKEEVLYENIFSYYKQNSSLERVKELIKDEVWTMNINVDGQEYDRKGLVSGFEYDKVELKDVIVSLNKLTIQKISTSNINNDEVEVLLNYKVLLQLGVSCYYNDYENSYWDSEEKRYLYLDTVMTYEKHKIFGNMSLKIKYDSSTNQSVSEKVMSDLDLELNQHTLISRSFPEMINDADFFEEGLSSQITKTIICEKCHKPFEVDFSQYVENSFRFEHGEDQMGTEIQYDIEEQIIDCPNCPAEYKISGSYNEYPIGCLNYDNTKIDLVTKGKTKQEE